MTLSHQIWTLATIAVSATLPVQQNWQRYTQPTALSAELPGDAERVDVRNEEIRSRVIQLNYTGRDAAGDFSAFYFVQAVIGDTPFDVDKKIAEDIAQAKDGGDAAVSKRFISQRPLKPSEMPLPGMRGIELVYAYSGFGAGGDQIQTSRTMYVGNKWLTVSVRHFEKDRSWPKDRFFNSVTWRP
ncbi:hypothetical protein [Sphingomonas sp.]|uniref:hypothetical protein n=1 Tax=Sphingomonas sp. TaxID=28214 RepID=UPI003BAD2F6F